MNTRKYRLMLEQGEGGEGGGGTTTTTAATTDTTATTKAADTTTTTTADTKAADTKTADTTATTTTTKDVAPEWAPDWRTKLAGEKPDKQLDRFASPKDVYAAWKALQTRLSSGELKAALPKDAKPEDVAKWRAENGIPEKHTDYKLPEGMAIGEADKPMIDLFLQDMHGKNAPPEVVQAAVQSYYKIQEANATRLAEADVAHKAEMEDALRGEWGGEYRGNINQMTAMLEQSGLNDLIQSARGPDGRAMCNHPAFINWLASTARELNPVATVVPAGGDQMGAITDEREAILKVMREDRPRYNKDVKMQQRLTQLNAAVERKTK